MSDINEQDSEKKVEGTADVAGQILSEVDKASVETLIETATSETQEQETSIETATSETQEQETSIETATSETQEQETSIETATSETQEQETSIETATSETQEQETSIETATSEVEEQETSIETATSEVEEQETSIETATSEVEEQETSIETATSEVEEQETSIEEKFVKESLDAFNTLNTLFGDDNDKPPKILTTSLETFSEINNEFRTSNHEKIEDILKMSIDELFDTLVFNDEETIPQSDVISYIEDSLKLYDLTLSEYDHGFFQDLIKGVAGGEDKNINRDRFKAILASTEHHLYQDLYKTFTFGNYADQSYNHSSDDELGVDFGIKDWLPDDEIPNKWLVVMDLGEHGLITYNWYGKSGSEDINDGHRDSNSFAWAPKNTEEK